MNVRELIEKAINGTMTDAEKESLRKYDADSVAAAARKSEKERADKAEAEATAAKADLAKVKLDADAAGKTEAQKIADAIKANEAKIDALTKERDAERSKAAAMVRAQKEDAVINRVKIIPGIDPDVPRLALRQKLKDLSDDALDGDAVNPVLTDFITRNKAIIQDESGGGSGTQNDGQNRGGGSVKPTITRAQYDAKTPAERSAFMQSGGNVKE